MRWRFLNECDPAEADIRSGMLQKIDNWWREFASKSDDLANLFSRRSQWDLPTWMNTHLQSISPHLMWEYGPAVSTSGHRLVITPESKASLRPIVRTIIERAPKLPKWEFYDYRLPENAQMASQTVQARVGRNLEGTLLSVSVGRFNRIDVCFSSPTTRSSDDKDALHAAFVATETLLGEALLDQWVGAVEVQSTPTVGLWDKLRGRAAQRDQRMHPLERLKPTFDAVIESLRDQLPPEPRHREPSECAPNAKESVGAVLQLKPRRSPADEYTGFSDLLVASTREQSLWMATHAGPPFYSCRYSRCGETFCYLKLDGSSPQKEKFADRASIEKAIDATLIPAGAGCVIGGGTGLRYSYIDLALVDVERAIPLLRSPLQAGNITPRSWLLFFDADLADEWVGVYEDCPPPPMPQSA